ncbi:MAG: hypothetical protein R3B97_06945 [Dehalococcoidia bacterium]
MPVSIPGALANGRGAARCLERLPVHAEPEPQWQLQLERCERRRNWSGERVNITWLEFGYSDTRTFAYPQFTFSIGLSRGSWSGSDTHTVTFSPSGQVTVNSVVENYPSQPCSVVWSPN